MGPHLPKQALKVRIGGKKRGTKNVELCEKPCPRGFEISKKGESCCKKKTLNEMWCLPAHNLGLK